MLGITGVTPADRFLELGGTSFAAARIIARLRDTFGVELQAGALVAPESTVTTLAVDLVAALAGPLDAGAVEEHLRELTHG